jgi:alpha-L-rhamnosidase
VGDLSYVKTSFNSSYGKVGSDWKVDGGKFVWNVTVPANATATVYIPAEDPAGITESNKPAGGARGIKYLRTEAGAVVYEVGSGSYRFASAMPK